MLIGYARVSTFDQNLDLQLRALEKAGCKKIFREKVSSTKRERPQFQRMLDQVRAGDTIVVWKLDRLSRSLKDLLRVQGLRIQAREEVEGARAYDQILVNSFFSRESVLRAYGLDARVCYLGIDTRTFIYQKLPREPFVVSLGMLVPEKNARFVIEAVSRLGEPRPPLVWIANYAGKSYRREMEELALIYQAKGLDHAEAKALAGRVIADKGAALDTLVREELGINPDDLGGSAWIAAISSFAVFVVGAIVPVAPFLVFGGATGVLASAAASAATLFLIGAAITVFTGRGVLFSGTRQLLIGMSAAAITYGVGTLLGTAIRG